MANILPLQTVTKQMGVITCYEKFSRRIGSLLEGVLTDAFLLVEGDKIPVHKCILAAHCEFFDSHFTQSQTDNVIDLGDFKKEVVLALLEYFYSGKYNFHEKLETDLLVLELAHKLKLKEDLEGEIIHQLVKLITVEKFYLFYNLNMLIGNSILLEHSCRKFLQENGEKFARSDSFSNLTTVSLLSLLDEQNFSAAEVDIFRATENWADVNKPDEQTVKDIVGKFRLATISQEDLFNVVENSRLFPNINIVIPVKSITMKDQASTNFRYQQYIPDAELNVAQASLEAKVLIGTSTGDDILVSGSAGCTSHKVGGQPDCILVMLKQVYRLNAINILLDSTEERSYKYYVEVSVDKKKWIKVVDHSNYQCRSNQFLKFDPIAFKFIKITGKEKELIIKFLEAMYTNTKFSLNKGIQNASCNVALECKGATVTGGSENPMNCIDGNEFSYAIVTEDSPLILTLGQPYWLSNLEIKLDSRGKSCTIETSSDGKLWDGVKRKPSKKEGIISQSIKFRRRIVLHIRVTVDDDNRIELYQLQVLPNQASSHSDRSFNQ